MTQRDADKIRKWLDDIFLSHGIFEDVYLDGKKRLVIEGVEGDWKHTHKYLDYLLEQKGFSLDEEKVSNSNSEEISDWYTSTHYYVPKKER